MLAPALRHPSTTNIATETDPFDRNQQVSTLAVGGSPIVARLNAIWASHRQAVLDVFPAAPGLPSDTTECIKSVEDIYKNDAYHSLSIEGDSVTPELIDRVRAGTWDLDVDQQNRQNRDALAARGYWQAFQSVKESVAEILRGEPAGAVVRKQHRDWYRELFGPSVTAGILKPSALVGYRKHPVYLRGSWHVPPRSEAVPDGMETLFDLLEKEREPAVRAVLGHGLIGYVHPYPDGNGRMARFLMNAMFASGGVPWTVVRFEDRSTYLAGLEQASVHMNVEPFAEFIAERTSWSTSKAI